MAIEIGQTTTLNGETVTKTGECYWQDANGQVWFAESFVDGNGIVETTQTEAGN